MLEEYRDDFELDLNSALSNQEISPANSINPYLSSEEPLPEARMSTPVSSVKTENYFNQLDRRKDIENLLKEDPEGGCLKNILMGFVFLLVIIGSFVASFYVGKKLFLSDPIVKEEFANISVSRELNGVKNKIKSVKDKLILEPELVAPQTNLETFDPAYISSTTATKPVVKTTPAKPAEPKVTPIKTKAVTKYRVIAGTYSQKDYAQDAARNLKNDGFETYVYAKNGKYRVQIGAFGSKAPATGVMNKAINLGYNAFVAVD